MNSYEHAPGEVIADKYELVRLLGEGGMGSVWVAHNRALDAHVALKLVRPSEHSEQLQQRLLTEARATARLAHPSIVRVFDFGATAAGEPFIVMELLTGESLGEQLDRSGRMNAVAAVQIMLPVAEGLAAAHAAGVVHRDLKPDNIYLTQLDSRRRQPKLLDFGVAQLEVAPGSQRVTQAGTVIGSPLYMAPEQARGAIDNDARADVFSFCVVLYEMLTGTTPFNGENYNAVMRAVIDDAPMPITEMSAGDDGLWVVLARGLEKAPEARWQSATELGRALADWLLAQGVGTDITGSAIAERWSLEAAADSDRAPTSANRLSNPHGLSQTIDSSPGVRQAQPQLALSRTTGPRLATPATRPMLLGVAAVALCIGAYLVVARTPESPLPGTVQSGASGIPDTPKGELSQRELALEPAKAPTRVRQPQPKEAAPSESNAREDAPETREGPTPELAKPPAPRIEAAPSAPKAPRRASSPKTKAPSPPPQARPASRPTPAPLDLKDPY